MCDEEKFIRDVKLFIALWENTATNLKRSNVKKCIENGADVNTRFANNTNNTPLHIAVAKGDRDIVNILLSYGAKTNVTNDDGKTALQIAKEFPECSNIADILKAHEETRAKDADYPIDNKAFTTTKCEYKKRPGTANVRGQLYETKLLTTIFLRVLRCEKITQFYLGTNVDEIGDLDDVCLRLKTRNQDCVLFLQAKYRHDTVKGRVGVQDIWRSSGDFSLLKYFDSYLRIREKFNLNSNDDLFLGRYEDIKPYFVIHTTVKDELNHTCKKSVAHDVVHDLLGTGERCNIFQLVSEEQYVDTLTNVKLIERVKNMGKKLIQLIQDDKYDMMLCDENIRNFHVILARKVIQVTDVNSEGHRIGTFREEFFSSDEQMLIVLRETLYAENIKYNKLSIEEIEALIHKISIEPTADTISDLIGSVLVYDSNNSTLKLREEGIGKKISRQYVLESVQVAQSEINEAFQIACRRNLHKLVFKLPAAFGNIDLTINKKKTERRLEYLARKICDVIKKSADAEGNIVIREGVFTSNKRLEAGVLGINGGIAGAVGNLLVSDNENKLKFNLDMQSLSENAKKLQLKIRESLKDISKYRFCVEIEDFPRLSLQASEHEKRYAKDFLNNLYFYTCQAKEEHLLKIAAKELQAHECKNSFNKSESQLKSNALFLKIHNEIQIWWMIDHSAYYLTRNMKTFQTIFSQLKNKGLLLFLNTLYLEDVYNAGIEFKTAANDVLSICKDETHEQRVIVVNTEAHVLTCHKLAQYFKNTCDYIFVDVDFIYKVSPSCFDMIFAELSEIEVPNVIIVCSDTFKPTYNIEDIIHVCRAKQIILVTNNYPQNNKLNVVMRNDKINLSDLTEASQRIVLQTQFSYQGIEVTFEEVFNKAKHLISATILQKMMTNEKIAIGKTLETSTYEEMKHYYVPRVLESNITICNTVISSRKKLVPASLSESNDESFTVYKRFSPVTLIDRYNLFENTRNGPNSDVVLILDAPGMGKSTLLTHLSLVTKQHHPKIWIQRINLIDYTKQFHEWQQNSTEIDNMEVLNFLCKVAVSKDTLRGKVCTSSTAIKFEIVNGEIKLAWFDEDCPVKLLELNTFLNSYKEKNIIFLFDGFDEISPNYTNEVIKLIKCLTHYDQVTDTSEDLRRGFYIWITSRPYNDLKNTLQAEFGKFYTLLPFSYYDTYVFVNKYMRRNLNLSTLTQGQLKNIDGFCEYMTRFDLLGSKQSIDTLNVTNVQLHGIYVAALECLKNEIKLTYLTGNLEYLKHWDFQEDVLMVWRLFQNEVEYTKAITLSGVPLNVYIAVHYLISQIKNTSLTDTNQRIQQWDLDTNTFAFYERFLETKLKTIRFEEKNHMDIYNPDVKMTCEREMNTFRDKHMKLAFYTVFEKEVLTDAEFDEVNDIIKVMENGQEKTGLVDRIINGKPKFVHYTFAEYFAVEHIFEILKSGDVGNQVRMLDFILNDMVLYRKEGFQVIFDLKLKCTSGLADLIDGFVVNQHIFCTLVQQSRDIDQRKFHRLRYSTVLDIIVENKLMHFAEFLIDAAINVVDETNISDFLFILENGKFLKCLVHEMNLKLVNKIMNCITSVDPTKFYGILGSVWTDSFSPFCS